MTPAELTNPSVNISNGANNDKTKVEDIKLRQVPLTCSGHTRPVVQLQFSKLLEPDNKFYMISACKDGNPILRDGATGDWIGTFIGHKGAVWSAKLNKSASLAVTGSADFSAKVWDAYSGTLAHTFNHKHIVRAVDFDHTNKIVTGGMEKLIRIFDLNSYDEPGLQFDKLENNIKYLAWDEQSNLIFSSGEEKGIRVFDPRTQAQVKFLETDNNVISMGLSVDNTLLECSAGKQASFWDLKTLELVKSHQFDFESSSVSVCPNTRDTFIAGGVSDLSVRKFDFQTGKELDLYKGHHGPVHSVSYSPDGEIYATGSEDGTIRLWQSTPGKPYGLWQLKKEDPITPTN